MCWVCMCMKTTCPFSGSFLRDASLNMRDSLEMNVLRAWIPDNQPARGLRAYINGLAKNLLKKYAGDRLGS